MSRPIPASAYVEHFDPELAHHRDWLLAVLEQLVTHDPQALEEGGTLRRLWTEHQQSADSSPQADQIRTAKPPSGAATGDAPSVEAPLGNPLTVPWFSQLDSSTDQARRMCFSSSCAMLLAFLKPGVLRGANGDDQYLQRVRRYGDTTDAAAQLQALASYGIEAEFTQKASFRTLEAQIAAGIPVPCGYLHRGPVEQPAGGGHWLIVVGHTPTHLIVHDPFGEADLVSGATIGGTSPDYGPMDFFRYTAAGVNQTGTGASSYFSIDGGVTNLNNWNNFQTGNHGDLGDWAPTAGNDAFNDNSNSGVVNSLTSVDVTLMNVIGWATSANSSISNGQTSTISAGATTPSTTSRARLATFSGADAPMATWRGGATPRAAWSRTCLKKARAASRRSRSFSTVKPAAPSIAR